MVLVGKMQISEDILDAYAEGLGLCLQQTYTQGCTGRGRRERKEGEGGGRGRWPLLISPVFGSAGKILTVWYSVIKYARKVSKNSENLGSTKMDS